MTFPYWGPLAGDSAKLKRSQLNVCTLYINCVPYGVLFFPPVTETCAGNLCQFLTTVTSGANSLVWVTVISQLASRVGEGGEVG